MPETLTIVLADDDPANVQLLARRLQNKLVKLSPTVVLIERFTSAHAIISYLYSADNNAHALVTDFDFKESANGLDVIRAAKARGGVKTFLWSGGYSAQTQVAIDEADASFCKLDEIRQLVEAVFEHIQHLVRLRANSRA